MKMKPHRLGLCLGALLGGFHLVWTILVALGVAQVIYDFILWAHMVHVPITIGPFDLTAALTLIIMTTLVGYGVGYIAAIVWNKLHA